jgi:hypothetical protein
MCSEESHNQYHLLHEAPTAAQWHLDDSSRTFRVQMIKSPPITRKRWAWMLLIVPAILLFIIAVLLCIMLAWLLYGRVKFDSSFASSTNHTLIIDESTQWCQLLAIARHANCDLKDPPSLLGLTLSGLLVSCDTSR